MKLKPPDRAMRKEGSDGTSLFEKSRAHGCWWPGDENSEIGSLDSSSGLGSGPSVVSAIIMLWKGGQTVSSSDSAVTAWYA